MPVNNPNTFYKVVQTLEHNNIPLGNFIRHSVRVWMKREYNGILTSQVKDLTRPEHGLHFNAGSVTAEKMKTFTVNKIAAVVWELVGNLMTADHVIIHCREKEREQRSKDRKLNRNVDNRGRKTQVLEEEEEEYYRPEIVSEHEDELEDIEELLEKQRYSLLQVFDDYY
ncbi:hypothetical protein AGABI1DRAFT_125794 [Agaricus bisporus var. burnettii JB137-S8]|uniref:Uncharacterized protein n=1 Tax=Agaricus bisporus var. burnettii (strain JB137-S8 / ATCC MYA-4627 / FGSC 10392) TaxID=597362 RepID=K5W3N0_AGABU|nr:uncharacterized protein AGABI1DRAFT_125794 [Agaricus bisporus var. burnettii JB137-S8]EKM81404.1 hypothetical protein AGABI1DRAFT_125794 [Agaricus bisporus var. burnettii JB137-S8]